MEKIIIWVVLMVGAVLYEQIKKYLAEKGKHSDEEKPKKRPRPVRQQMRPVMNRPAPPPPPVATPVATPDDTGQPSSRFETPLARAARLRSLPAEGECALSEHHLHSGETDEAPAAPAVDVAAATEEERKAREAHFARWRRAIVDTQILERKF